MDFFAQLARWLLRGALALIALTLFCFLLLIALLWAAIWLVRALWAKLTGQPLAGWTLRVDPRQGWHHVMRQQPNRVRTPTETAETVDVGPRRLRGPFRPDDDVTDVQPREPRQH